MVEVVLNDIMVSACVLSNQIISIHRVRVTECTIMSEVFSVSVKVFMYCISSI